ncbi:golvesin C-terminal-like domain-containing protein [Jiangella alkaliphila]|uniref:NPCBM-associated, NEW3 domain of alpha-galactosidase n=1 Tax=Jiangella alkaliphila TaxID=419479 RepID=A0A1H2JLN3_9ACTN|nr:NEW3 domain-containing protein [Jiangella alkaliphila]SDU57262.1 NPCBM-associated, NEW3 domain of alpha-galactosidase [Jiangella alkaliphila]
MHEVPRAAACPNPSLSRRSAIRLLVGAAVLPPVVNAFGLSSAAAATTPAAEGQPPLPDALRRLPMPDLATEPAATITGDRHRVTFHRASWGGGHTYVRDLEVQTDGGDWLPVTAAEHRFDEQWIVLTGDDGNPTDYYTSMTPNWVAFDSLAQLDAHTVELRSTPPGGYDLTVRWSLAGASPELQWTLTAGADDHYVVGYQSVDAVTPDDVDEVLCGSWQHARVIGGAQSLGAWELFAPMSLTQRRIGDHDVTLGVYTPGEVLLFEHEREPGPDGQPFGMSLRNDDRDVQPVVFAPQAGRRTPLAAGESRGYAFGLYAAAGTVYQSYTDLVRNEYGYTDYRRNVYDTSLTDTVHHLIDLLMVEPDGDDSESFVPSFSGWWNRAKGFVDIENDQAVRTPIAGVLLSAYHLTGDDALYERRARPLVEYHLSRAGHGSTPVKGAPVYGNPDLYRIGRIPGDASTLVPLYEQTRGQNAGLHSLAMELIRQRPGRDARTPMSTPLQAYVLTGNEAYLAEARAEARRLIRDQIMRPYATNAAENEFGYHYVKAWTELLVLFELTGEQEFLDGSYREAQRYLGVMNVRPVPDTTVTVPNQPFIDNQIDWWNTPLLPDYPQTTVPSEEVPAWTVSSSGVTFEQLSTFKVSAGRVNPGGGFTWIPAWAPFFLRLAHHTGDDLFRDVAHNLVVGRFTNYPGYYNRQFSVAHMKPDFPYQGPPGAGGIYFHHIPAQLGLALDYLITEHQTRSDGEIDFPRQFETNYVFFKFSTYGHAPGTFHGEDGVWPYFPKGIVGVDNPQVNWLTAVGNGSLYLSLTNESDTDERVTVDVATPVTGLARRAANRVEVLGGGVRTAQTLRGGRLTTTIPAKGHAALVVRDVDLDVPWHWTSDAADQGPDSHHHAFLDPAAQAGLVRAVLLVRPDRSGYDAYVQADTETTAQLHYAVGDAPAQQAPAKVFPFEWTIPVGNLTAPITFRVVAGDRATADHTLRLPPSVTGVVPPGEAACGELSAAPDTTPGDDVRVRARVRNGTDAPLDGAELALAVPSGWTAAPVGDVPASVPAGGTADWLFDVTAPADATGAAELTATARWTGGSTVLTPATVAVLVPLKLPALTAVPAELARPGDAFELTTAVLNLGPVRRSGTLQVSVPAGWRAEPAIVGYDVPGREEREYTVTVTSAAGALPGTAHRITVAADASAQQAVTVRLTGTEIVVDNADPWPRYVETGWWLPSTLAGWNRTASRFSEEDRLGGTATWTPELPADGVYDVAVWYPSNADTTRAAVYVVRHADGEDEIVVDQQQDANGWRALGRFRFTAGTGGSVRIEVRNPGFHRVDAARFLPVDAAALLPVVSGLAAADVAAPGGGTTVTATLRAQDGTPVRGTATLATPGGWTVTPAEIPVDLAGGATTTLEFALTAPADAAAGSLHELALSAAGAEAAIAVAIGAPNAAAAVVVDDEDTGYTDAGGWSASSLLGHDGSRSRFAGGGSGAVATWSPELAAAGRYRVSVWYPTNATTTREAVYTVVTAGGERTVVVDQQAGGAAWRPLAIVDLDPATAAVRLAAQNSGHHRADAARFEPVVPAQ